MEVKMNLKQIVKTGLVVGGLLAAVNGFAQGNYETGEEIRTKLNYEAQSSPFAVAEFNQLYGLLEKAEGTVLPKPLSLVYGNEKINILVEDINSKFFIEIKEGTIVEISNAVKDDYTLDVRVKNVYTIFSIIK